MVIENASNKYEQNNLLNISSETFDNATKTFDWKNTKEALDNELINDLINELNITSKNEKDAFNKILAWITIDSIKDYSDVKKAQVANELSMLMQITEDPLWTIQKKLNKWAPITPETFWVTCWDDVQNLLEQAQSLQKEKAIDLYKKFGGNIENYPNFVNLATWDGSSTNWEQWVTNVWRIFWSYPTLKDVTEQNVDRFVKSVNYFNFSNEWNDASILIEPTWINGDWWGDITLILTDENWNKYSKTCSYRKDGLFCNGGNLPNDIKFSNWISDDKQVCVIKIPSIYSDYNIQIETSSQKNWNIYDEIKFGCRIINWEIANTKKIGKIFKSGEYKLNEESKKELKNNLTKIPNIYNKQVPLTCWVNIDNKWYYIPDADANTKLKQMKDDWNTLKTELISKIWEEIVTDLISKCEDILWKFKNKTRIDKDGKAKEMTPSNLAIQKQLAENRFLEAFNVLLDDDKFKTSVLEWKKIMPRFSVTKDNRSISIW